MATPKKPRRQLEPFEVNLLMENASLLVLAEHWLTFVKVTERELENRRDYLDPRLAECIEQCFNQVRYLLYVGADLQQDDEVIAVPSIAHFLKESNAQCEVLQAGKPPKRGGPKREQENTPPPPRGMPPSSHGRP